MASPMLSGKRRGWPAWIGLLVVMQPVAAADLPPSANLTCPVLLGEPALAEFHTEYQGRTIYFCCASCVKKFQANPSAYLANLPTLPPEVKAFRDDTWHWWESVDHILVFLAMLERHRILLGTLAGVAVLALATRVQGRKVDGVRRPSQVASFARSVFRWYPMLLIILSGFVVDYVTLTIDRSEIVAAWEKYRFQWIIVAVVLGLGCVANLFHDRSAEEVSSAVFRYLRGIGHPGVSASLALTLLLSIVSAEWLSYRDRIIQSERRIGELRSSVQGLAPNTFQWAWPQGFHELPRGIKNTYYRGNDERSEQLFNRGNYLTATFHVSLHDGSGREVQVGEPLGQQQLAIWLDTIRGPKTARNFFSRSLMRRSFFSNGYGTTSDPIRLQVLEEDQSWRATLPLGEVPATGYHGMKGVWYYAVANSQELKLEAATIHYFVQYALHFQDGVLLPESTIWMAPIFPSPILQGPNADAEWFSDRPIPAITGENSTDPKLLGITDSTTIRPEEKASHSSASSPEK
jgi:YHS domain-containing protein